MKTARTLIPIAFALALTSVAAQVPPPAEEAKPALQSPKRTPDTPKKVEVKKAEVKKSQPVKKVEAPKKAVAPKQEPAQTMTGSPNVRIFKAGDPNIPTLLDKEGKAIPSNPNAYDVSSATKK